MDGVKVVDNDGNAQSATIKCSLVSLIAGIHSIYIEGWSQSAQLSLSATYQGVDTNNSLIPIQAVVSPAAPSHTFSIFEECNPSSSFFKANGNGLFTICGFAADNDVDLVRVEDVHAYYSQVFLPIL